jgi:hypothetical protein
MLLEALKLYPPVYVCGGWAGGSKKEALYWMMFLGRQCNSQTQGLQSCFSETEKLNF